MDKYCGIISVVNTQYNHGNELANTLLEEVNKLHVVSSVLMTVYDNSKGVKVFQIFFESSGAFSFDLLLSKKSVSPLLKALGNKRGMLSDEIQGVFYNTEDQYFKCFSLDFMNYHDEDSFTMKETSAFKRVHFDHIATNVTESNSTLAELSKLQLDVESTEGGIIRNNKADFCIGCFSVVKALCLTEMLGKDEVQTLKYASLLFE